MRKLAILASILATFIGFGSRAEASVVYTLDVSTVSTGTQGTVTLTQVGANEVDVLVNLVTGDEFVNTGGPHTPFVFNLASSVSGAVISILSSSNPSPAGFSVLSGSQDATPYGTFTNGIGYLGSNGGGKHGNLGPLSFSVVASGITIDDFVANADGYLFAADLFTSSGATGSVAAIAPVPLPAALPLFGMAILGVAGFGRRFARRG